MEQTISQDEGKATSGPSAQPGPRVMFVDRSGTDDETAPLWSAVKITKEEIDAEIDRLAGLPEPQNGRRRSLLVHEDSTWGSFTPGIEVAIEVLCPGEEARPYAHNGSSVGFCIGGEGEAQIDDDVIGFSRFDVWSIPNMAVWQHRNTGKDVQARLMFSDAPLLRLLRSHYVDPDFRRPEVGPHERDAEADRFYPMPSGGGAIKPYQAFIDPELVEQRPLVWKWDEVRAHLNSMDKSSLDWRVASIAMLWNPRTGRTHGSTNTLTAWMSGGRDPQWTESKFRMARSHRHSVTAINYSVSGQWRTVVEREDIRWGPGDLVITAPGWGIHSNGTCDEEAYTFTLQDSALHGALNTGLFQEYMRRPPVLLGSHPGFHAAEEPE
jgi:gentisate 1,2-dioxygenase